MKWLGKGLIFNPENRFPWMRHYAQVPTPVLIDDVLRIYFTTRPPAQSDGQFISLIGFIDVDPENPKKILKIHDKPVMQPGAPGCFDEFGVMPGFVRTLPEKGKLEMYYTGWTRLTTTPFCTRIGRAVSYDGGFTFKRDGIGPYLGLSREDPLLINGPFCLSESGMHHIWYASGKKWIHTNGKYEIVYQIKHAQSADKKCWKREDTFCLPPELENEAQNRPVVFPFKGRYHMWFCYREALDFRHTKGAGYRLGHAVSDDLSVWQRDNTTHEPTFAAETWDAEMRAYPFVMAINDKIYLFYNGNYFGKVGFGYAELSGD